MIGANPPVAVVRVADAALTAAVLVTKTIDLLKLSSAFLIENKCPPEIPA
jgi:hypothetical protein